MSAVRSQPITFSTPSGVEVPAVTTDQMREIDRIAMEETGPNLFQMMENAGRNLAEMAIECLGANWRQAKIVVLAGTGGNGGGGITAARHLANLEPMSRCAWLVLTSLATYRDGSARFSNRPAERKSYRKTSAKTRCISFWTLSSVTAWNSHRAAFLLT